MKTINISKKKLESLEPLQIPNSVVNTESILYNYNYPNNLEGVLKKLYLTSGNVYSDKIATIEKLNYYREILPNSFVIPDNLVSVKGDIVAFTMPKISGQNLSILLSDSKCPHELQLHFLKEIGSILNKLKNIRSHTELTDIFINDLQECNFIANPYSKDLYVVDTDSCRIANNIPSPARYLTKKALLNCSLHKYIENRSNIYPTHIIADENSDLYCYCIIILNYLSQTNINEFKTEEFYNYMNYLSSIKVSKDLIDALEKIVSYNNNINPLEYIDSLTDESIARANIKVYNYIRNKNKT